MGATRGEHAQSGSSTGALTEVRASNPEWLDYYDSLKSRSIRRVPPRVLAVQGCPDAIPMADRRDDCRVRLRERPRHRELRGSMAAHVGQHSATAGTLQHLPEQSVVGWGPPALRGPRVLRLVLGGHCHVDAE